MPETDAERLAAARATVEAWFDKTWRPGDIERL
jgi:hypothetical protein